MDFTRRELVLVSVVDTLRVTTVVEAAHAAVD